MGTLWARPRRPRGAARRSMRRSCCRQAARFPSSVSADAGRRKSCWSAAMRAGWRHGVELQPCRAGTGRGAEADFGKRREGHAAGRRELPLRRRHVWWNCRELRRERIAGRARRDRNQGELPKCRAMRTSSSRCHQAPDAGGRCPWSAKGETPVGVCRRGGVDPATSSGIGAAMARALAADGAHVILSAADAERTLAARRGQGLRQRRCNSAGATVRSDGPYGARSRRLINLGLGGGAQAAGIGVLVDDAGVSPAQRWPCDTDCAVL